MKYKSRNVYRAKHPQHAKRQIAKETENYWPLFKVQLLVCGALLMGILVLQRLPEGNMFGMIRQSVLSEMSFSRHNQWYERFMVNFFPFSYTSDALSPEPTLAVVGEGEGTSEQESLTASLVRNITYGIELHYADGIIVNAFREENILSPVLGTIIDKGTDRSNEIGDYVIIQMPDNYLLTIGFLQNIRVTRLDHIQVGTALGEGSLIEDLGEDAYFYLSVQNSQGEFIDTVEFLNQLVLNERAN